MKSVTAKLTVFVVLAVVFAGTMVGLSLRNPHKAHAESFSSDRSEKIEKTFTVESGGRLVIDSDEGDISIQGTSGSEVKVVVYTKGNEERRKDFTVDFEQEGNTVKIEGKRSRNHFRFWDGDWFDVRFEVQVPNNFNVELHTAGGDIVLEKIKGDITGETAGGDVKMAELEGEINLHTSGGDILLDDSKGTIEAKTSGGDVTCENVEGNLNVETSGGDIRVTHSDVELNAETSGGDIIVSLKDNHGIHLSTAGGDVKVKLPKTITADVDASTAWGDVDCDLPFSGKIKNGEMHGQINGGGKPIHISCSGGDVKIESLD
jgi:DUF4097 and DUF4098 domain-containing protein YvlB